MPKQTLLEMTQKILSDLDSDEVNSINDTIEATQVAHTIINCFYDVCQEMDLSFEGELTVLEQVATPDKPTLMKLPDSVSRVEWINYGLGAPEVATTPPTLLVESNGSFNVLSWSGADFGNQDVDSYDIYRFNTLSNPAPEEYDEYGELTYWTTVSAATSTLQDEDYPNTTYWTAYYVKAVAEDESELNSNIAPGQQPS